MVDIRSDTAAPRQAGAMRLNRASVEDSRDAPAHSHPFRIRQLTGQSASNIGSWSVTDPLAPFGHALLERSEAADHLADPGLRREQVIVECGVLRLIEGPRDVEQPHRVDAV